ncbi:MAG: hypothetical protein AAFQ80_09945 [Cyanobacteria bacterium J06621_8]
MNSRKSPKFKGFGKFEGINGKKPVLKTRNSADNQAIAEITSICQNVDQMTAAYKHPPQALEKFIKLVNQGNIEQLTAYFAQYGIDSEFIAQNIDILIAEELNNLSSSNC